MRYQERIYTQNLVSGTRNRNFNNFGMSTDICVFNNPMFNISGATKLDCTGSTSGATYIITATTENIVLSFDFTGNTQTFTDTDATFKYKIYKFDSELNKFSVTPNYSSDILYYSGFSATNITTQYVPVSALTLDGEYIIKGSYQFNACTNILNKLGKTIDTGNYIFGSEYGIYNNDIDFYFIAFKEADKPNFIDNQTNIKALGALTQTVFIPETTTNILTVPSSLSNEVIITLNGIVLAKGYDYTLSGNVLTLSGETNPDDILSYIYTSAAGNPITHDTYLIDSSIVSGVTDGQGNNSVYFNTNTNKFEVFLSVEPRSGSDIILMLNGATLANGVDFYQSITNTKRLILEGVLLIEDIITIIYYPQNTTVNGLINNNPTISWGVENLPQNTNGYFSLQVSTGDTFNDFYYSGLTNHDINSTYYNDSFIASGTVGTKLYYRVKNVKVYETICGDFITSIKYSDTVPLVIQSNSINSY